MLDSTNRTPVHHAVIGLDEEAAVKTVVHLLDRGAALPQNQTHIPHAEL